MSISLTEALKRFVKERTKAGNFSNPSDYVCSPIREDQRRLAAEKVLAEMVAKHVAANPSVSPESLDKLRAEFWLRWIELKGEIDKGRSCPTAWCSFSAPTVISGLCRIVQAVIADKLTRGSSLKGAMVSRVM